MEVTHVWAMSTWNTGIGMRWGPEWGWLPFDKLLRQARLISGAPWAGRSLVRIRNIRPFRLVSQEMASDQDQRAAGRSQWTRGDSNQPG